MKHVQPLDIKRPFLAGPQGLDVVPALVLRNGRVASQHISALADRQFDADGLIASPGYIDLQTNGGFGIDFTAEPDRIWEFGARLPETGATAFYPTLISPDPTLVDRAKQALQKRPTDFVGAEPLGLHLEGPMLATQHCGIHNPNHLRPADGAIAAAWTATSGVSLVTLAPELPGALGVIATLRDAGVVVSGGHSDATEDETAQAEQAGLTLVTHLFNAMTPLHHRRPGIVGRVLTGGNLAATMIADGFHVAPSVMSLAWQLLGPERLALVSDSVAALGTEPGPSTVAGTPVEADNNTVRSVDGVLAGSRSCLAVGVRNLIRYAGAELTDALGSASAVPARIMGLDDRGHLATGARADLVLLHPDLTVAATVSGGNLAYVDPSAADRLTEA